MDITEEQYAILLNLINLHLPSVTVWACGSRVTGTSNAKSDLDLVIFSTKEHAANIASLREACEESSLPFRVDIVLWDDLPETYQQSTKMQHTVLVSNMVDEYIIEKKIEVGLT
ncbi:MAG: nucleotidyltransferase domain-containing protein [Magnetococcales bacterium]|nr:nucleotidyltransferase domain-containing protein [Magnetococcales bacterium]